MLKKKRHTHSSLCHTKRYSIQHKDNSTKPAVPAITTTLPEVNLSATTENKLTWNASTSSIHNDLKMILEESKKGIAEAKTAANQQTSPVQTATAASLDKEKPKPQRAPTQQKEKAASKDTAPETSHSANLVKMMMMMVENNKNASTKLSMETTSQTQQESQHQKSYTREFLHQIRQERADFIDKILPDIFKAYCYCMKGKLWDPEKYFDIVQFPGEDFEKLQHLKQQQQQQQSAYHAGSMHPKSRNSTRSVNSYPKNPASNVHHLNTNLRKKPTHSTSSYTGLDLLNEPFLSNIESPEPLQVPKNSPKSHPHVHQKQPYATAHTKAKKASNLNLKSEFNTGDYLSMPVEHLETRTEADKMLLGLLNKASSKQANTSEQSQVNLLDMLNTQQPKATTASNSSAAASAKKSSSKPLTHATNSNILDGLFTKNKASALSTLLGINKLKFLL